MMRLYEVLFDPVIIDLFSTFICGYVLGRMFASNKWLKIINQHRIDEIKDIDKAIKTLKIESEIIEKELIFLRSE